MQILQAGSVFEIQAAAVDVRDVAVDEALDLGGAGAQRFEVIDGPLGGEILAPVPASASNHRLPSSRQSQLVAQPLIHQSRVTASIARADLFQQPREAARLLTGLGQPADRRSLRDRVRVELILP